LIAPGVAIETQPAGERVRAQLCGSGYAGYAIVRWGAGELAL
jgi:hypothetical protein